MRRTLVAAALAACVAPAATAGAQQFDPQALTVHGYLTQGYASASNLPILGIDSLATGDYRSAALQFRYALTDKDAFVVQLSHRRLGKSVLNQLDDDVALDWGFYNRRIGGTSVRVGRVPMPRGIYNETRDVGVLLPFYRAPYNFYTEGVETMDGATVSRTFTPFGAWALNATAFGGGWDFKQAIPSTTTGQMTPRAMRAEKVVGGQLWLNTPLPGVRFGGNLQRMSFEQFPFAYTPNREADGTLGSVSADANILDRGFVRSEYALLNVDDFAYRAYYVQAGAKLPFKLALNGQLDVANIESPQTVATPMGPHRVQLRYNYATDRALGLNYHHSSNLVLKTELHQAKGYNFDKLVLPTGPAGRTNYLITSLSVSF